MSQKYIQAPEDLLIRIKPHIKRKQWTGEIDVSIISSEDNPLNDQDFDNMMFLCELIASSIPIMEEDEYVRSALFEYAESYRNTMEVVDDPQGYRPEGLEEDEPVVDKEGNIIKINFSTKTRGSA